MNGDVFDAQVAPDSSGKTVQDPVVQTLADDGIDVLAQFGFRAAARVPVNWTFSTV
jgi:hypothetical protein